jgi:predicted amidohydrolase
VAAAQVALDVDDQAGSRQRLEVALEEAVRAGAQLVVLPELASCGYDYADMEEAQRLAQPVDGEFVSWLQDRSRQLGVVVVAGLAEAADGQVYNSAVVVDAGTVLPVYRKAHLWGREPLFFTAGAAAPEVVDTSVGRVAVMICYDLEFPEWVRLAAVAGADIVAVPSNWPALPRPAGERPLEVLKAQAFAGIYRVFVVVADRCGVERGQDWIGGSVIVGPDGWPLAGPASDVQPEPAPVVLLADLDLTLARDKSIGARNHVWDDRRPELYG